MTLSEDRAERRWIERRTSPRRSNEPTEAIQETAAARSFALAELSAVRAELIDRIWLGIAFLAMIGVPVSVSRAAVTGWMPMYTAHIVLGAITLAIFFNRRRCSLSFKTWAILALFSAVGVIGIIQIGPFGAGLWWLATCPFLAATLFSLRAGYYSMLAVLAVLVIVASAYVTGLLRVQLDAPVYAASTQAWATLAIGACLMPLVVFQGISLFTRQMVDLAEKQHHLKSQIAQQRDRLQALAFQDELTGAETRRVMIDRLEQRLRNAQRSGERAALMMVDLNDFKPLNDELGHAAGDEALKAFYQRMRAVLRPSDSVARFGGDEFVVLIDYVQDLQEASQIAERLSDAISQPIQIAGADTRMSASIGVAIMPDQGQSTEALLESADAAMYEAKRQSKTRRSVIRMNTVTPLAQTASRPA